MKKKLDVNRRQLLQWSTPVIVSVALPAHAQMSVCQAEPPMLTVLAAPKCSGKPPVGTAVIEITSASEVPVTISNITVTTSDPKSDISSIPALPFEVTETSGETITWIGPASDGLSCLPLATISITVEYSCDDEPSQTEDYDITDLLVNSAP